MSCMGVRVEYVLQSKSHGFCHRALYGDLRVCRESIGRIALEMETEIYLGDSIRDE